MIQSREKLCHQCRQKTLGHCTHCSKCGMVQRQYYQLHYASYVCPRSSDGLTYEKIHL